MAESEVEALKCENQRLRQQNKTLIDMLSTLKQMKEMFAIMEHTFNDLNFKIDEIVLQNSTIESNDIADIDISFDASLVKDEKQSSDHTIIVHQIINAANHHNNNNNNGSSGGNNRINNTTAEENNAASYNDNNGTIMVLNDTMRVSSQPQYINLYAADKPTSKLALVSATKQRNRNFFASGKSTKVRRKRLAKSKLKLAQQSSCNGSADAKTGGKQQQQADTNNSNKPYVCHWADCQYSTAIKAHFKVHLRKHTGEKPYRCDHQNCDYIAASSSQVSRHRRIHLRSAIEYFNT